MNLYINHRYFLKTLLGDTVYILIGGGLFAAGLCIFAVPSRIIIGGATGISALLNHFTGMSIGLGIWLINLPLFIATYYFTDKLFTFKTIYTTTLFSAIIDVVARFDNITYTKDPMLAAVFGGILMGMGLFFVMSRNLLTGGSELVAYLVQIFRPGKSISRLILFIDTFIVVTAAILYRSIETGLYSIFIIIIYTLVLDNYLRERALGKIAFIFSTEYARILEVIVDGFERGVSIMETQGGYTGEKRKMLMCGLRLDEAARLRQIVFEIDKKAFLILTEATQISGEGFDSPQNKPIS